jgi:hypothetical protein
LTSQLKRDFFGIRLPSGHPDAKKGNSYTINLIKIIYDLTILIRLAGLDMQFPPPKTLIITSLKRIILIGSAYRRYSINSDIETREGFSNN